MEWADASLVREILRLLDYEEVPGSNNPISEHWIGPDGSLVFFSYPTRGNRTRFLGQSVRTFIHGLPVKSLWRVNKMLEER